MVINVKDFNSPEQRCMRDLVHNANTKDYINEKGFKQKLIDLLYDLGYYESNESIFSNIQETQ